jgi:hypothetical protein
MRRLISYLDLTAPKFNLFINGKSRYRTFSGGIFHLLTGLTIIILTVNILIDFSKHQNPSIVINTSEYTPDLIRNKKRIDQDLTIQVHKELNEHHVFSVAGSFIDKNNSQMIRSEDNISSVTNTYVLNLSNINFSDTEYFFISFPRCNNDTYLCENPNNTSDEAYKNFTDGEKSLYFFNLEIPRLKINLYNYTDKFETEYQKKSIYVNKKRGVYYIIYLKLIIIDEKKGIFFRSENKTYAFSVDNIDEYTVDDYSWNEYSYSMFLKFNKQNTVMYIFTYKTLLNVFSDIGGIANFLSFFLTIKNILSLHYADIFMLNYNFFNNLNNDNKINVNNNYNKITELEISNNQNEKLDMPLFKNEINEEEFDLSNNNKKKKVKNNYQSDFVYDKSKNFLGYCGFLKYKIFKCCLKKDKSKNLYLNYKWIFDINYLLRMYLQIKLLKSVLLTPNQRRLIENLSLLEKIDVYSRLNIDNFYLQKPIKNEEERQQLINKEIENYLQKKPPYKNDDLDEEENSFIQKLLNID